MEIDMKEVIDNGSTRREEYLIANIIAAAASSANSAYSAGIDPEITSVGHKRIAANLATFATRNHLIDLRNIIDRAIEAHDKGVVVL